MRIICVLPAGHIEVFEDRPSNLSAAGFERLTVPEFPADFSFKVFVCVRRDVEDGETPKMLYSRLLFDNGNSLDASAEIRPDPNRATQSRIMHFDFTLESPCKMTFEAWTDDVTGERVDLVSWALQAVSGPSDQGPRWSL